MSQSPPEHVRENCACGAKINLPAAAAGQETQCPECQATIEVTNAEILEPESGLAAEEDPISDDSTTGIEDDSSSTVDPASNTAKPRSVLRFSLGILASCFGAAIGAAVWAAVGVFVGVEHSWIAIGLGAIAGFGMCGCYQRKSICAGVTAAIIAILAIISAKAIMVDYVESSLRAEHKKLAETMASDEYRLAAEKACAYARKHRIQPGTSWDSLLDSETTRLNSLSDTELRAELAQFREWESHGRLQDQDWVRDYVIYHLIESKLFEDMDSADADSEPQMSAGEWELLYSQAEAEIDGLTTGDRLGIARKIIEQNEEHHRHILSSLENPAHFWSSSEGIAAFYKGSFDGMDILFMGVACLVAFTAGMSPWEDR